MKMLIYPVIVLSLWPVTSFAGKRTPVQIIAREPVTMMDLGILKLNAYLNRPRFPGLHGATMVAKYNIKHGTIDIKVSKPVKKASRSQCKNLVNNTRKIFVRPYGKKLVSNIHHYFHHEGAKYSRHIDWNDLANYVVITGIVLTEKNYQDSTYCQSKLMKKKVSYK